MSAQNRETVSVEFHWMCVASWVTIEVVTPLGVYTQNILTKFRIEKCVG